MGKRTKYQHTIYQLYRKHFSCGGLVGQLSNQLLAFRSFSCLIDTSWWLQPISGTSCRDFALPFRPPPPLPPTKIALRRWPKADRNSSCVRFAGRRDALFWRAVDLSRFFDSSVWCLSGIYQCPVSPHRASNLPNRPLHQSELSSVSVRHAESQAKSIDNIFCIIWKSK